MFESLPPEPKRPTLSPEDRRRLGRFTLPIDEVRDHPDELADIFMGIVVIRAEARIDSMSVEYSAWSMEFESVKPWFMPPWYEAIVKRDRDEQGEESVSVEWRRRADR